MTDAMLSGAVFTALADATRRQIFELVAASPRSVADLADRVTVSRPAVSQHLKVLKDARLVSDRADGTRRVYALDDRGLRAARGYLERFWDRALHDFKQVAEAAARDERNRR